MANIINRYLGIDYGTVRIGLALGDSETKIAMPFAVVGSIEEIIKIIEDEQIDELVVGSPLTMRNEAGNMKNEVDRFIKILESKTKLPIKIIDERLSSKGADALVGNKKTKADRDAIAAMIILQSYFDKQLR
jgi:putative Holliday junction resolvase